MIEIEHNGSEILNLYRVEDVSVALQFSKKQSLISQFYDIADQNPNDIIIWYHTKLKDHINRPYILNNFKDYMMWSYASNTYLGDAIGYVEDSPFLKIAKDVKYPTWLMTSNCGVIHARQLLKFKNTVKDKNLDFALNSIGKLGLTNGLWCYSSPQILLRPDIVKSKSANINNLYKFIASHYKKRWILLLFINLLIYEKRFTLVSLCYGLFFKKRTVDFKIELSTPNSEVNKRNFSLDVIIPTMGRKKYLYDFLKDLKEQSTLPSKVIIVEQNPEPTSSSELDYLNDDEWPFEVKHIFIHQTGACNARNIALDLVTSEYVFFADDDIRLEDKELLERTFKTFAQLDINAINLACLQVNETDTVKNIKQWAAFGSASSMVLSRCVKNLRFNMALEHGYGEDVDFGMQLRNIGEDVIYAPNLKLLHLKAPIGGFRSDIKSLNETTNNQLLPKPSPTIMLFRMLHTTKAQLSGYKTTLAIKYYKAQNVKNPFAYIKQFKKRWRISEDSAINLINQNNH